MTKAKPTKHAPARKPGTTTKVKPPGKPKAARPRKPRVRRAAKKPELMRRKLVWRGVLIAIQYEPERCGYLAHLELRVVAPKGVPLPVTERGYRSHYVSVPLVKAEGGPVAYVRDWLDRTAGSKPYLIALDRWRQLDLFGP
jgi:hypothetical protein